MDVYYPKSKDLIVRTFDNSSITDIDICRDNCKKLFPIGRVFVSTKQLEQVIQYFSKGWKALTTGGLKNQMCI